jgi:hypothetical protein
LIRLSYVDAAARVMRFKIDTVTSHCHGYVIVSTGIRFNRIQSFSATYQDASFKVATGVLDFIEEAVNDILTFDSMEYV